MHRLLLCVLVLASCDDGSGAGDDGVDQFEGDCPAAAAGSPDTCGQISVRWSIERPGTTATATCTDVDGASVRVTATFQPDGRVATFTPTCASGATLTPRMPLGPYALNIELLDAANVVLDRQPTTATIGVGGTVTEAAVAFDVVLAGRPGQLFGACSATQPCRDAAHSCTNAGGVQMCTPACSSTTARTVCGDAFEAAGLESPIDCLPTDMSGRGYCFVTCTSQMSMCPAGLTCRELNMFLGPVCLR